MSITFNNCCGNHPPIDIKECSSKLFTNQNNSFYFNPKTKEVFQDKDLKNFVGHGIFDEETKTLQITKKPSTIL